MVSVVVFIIYNLTLQESNFLICYPSCLTCMCGSLVKQRVQGMFLYVLTGRMHASVVIFVSWEQNMMEIKTPGQHKKVQMCEICLMHYAIKHHIYSLSFFFNLHNYFSTHTFLSFYHHDIIVYDYDCWMCFFIVLSNIHFILFSTLLTLPIPSNSSFYLLLFTSFPSFLPSFLSIMNDYSDTST